jgi:molybdopterin molybdotransferase
MTKLDAVTARFPDYTPEALPVSTAQDIIAATIEAVADTVTVGLADALDRVAAHDVQAGCDVPPADNSAMDGYAFDGAALGRGGDVVLTPAGHAYAGRPFTGEVPALACVRIMTGAAMPAACDTVIPHERVDIDARGCVRFPAAAVPRRANVRHRGEEIAAGQVALAAGRLVGPAEIALLAAAGCAALAVRRTLRVALMSTGDELREPGQPLDVGMIYDSNRYALGAALRRLHVRVLDLGIVADRPEAIGVALDRAVRESDMVITSGGVSAGDADFTRALAAQRGDVAQWNLAMRPGRPLAFGTLPDGARKVVYFGLPGNPVAALVSFYRFVRPALLALSGATRARQPVEVRATAARAIPKRLDRTEVQRGVAARSGAGELRVTPVDSQGSAALRSLAEANCLVILPAGTPGPEAGDAVDIVLFDGLV